MHLAEPGALAQGSETPTRRRLRIQLKAGYQMVINGAGQYHSHHTHTAQISTHLTKPI